MKRIRMGVVGGVTLAFILVTVLVFTIAIRLNHQSTENALLAEQRRLEQQLVNANRDIEYFETWDFIERYMRDHLGWGRPGQYIFQR